MKPKPPKGGWVQSDLNLPTTKPKDPRDELQQMMKEYRDAERSALHNKLVNTPRIKELAEKTGLTGDELFAIADKFKGEANADALEAIANDVRDGTPFADAMKRWESIIKPDREGETHGSTK